MRKTVPNPDATKTIWFCDKCGKETEFHEASLTLSWGYGGDYDGEEMRLVLCYTCQGFISELRTKILAQFPTVDKIDKFNV